LADVAANDYKSWMECAAEDRGEGVLALVMDVWWPPFARRAWPTTEEGWKKRTGARTQHVGWMDYGEILFGIWLFIPCNQIVRPKPKHFPPRPGGDKTL
jgi:hypothetical protein